MAHNPGDLSSILLELLDAEVEFVLVGGGAALIHGAPITTQDVDIVHSRAPANVSRLHTVLTKLDAHALDLANRRLPPAPEALSGSGQLLLRTSLGRLDVLCTLHDGRGYDELVGSAQAFALKGRTLHVIDLPTLIEIKRSTGRAKDRLVVPVLIDLARKGREDG